MSAYKKQEQEIGFISRTKKLLEQYDKFQIDKEEKFEVTLLLNCFVGLVMLPRQQCKNLPNDKISSEIWGISPDNISTSDEKNISNVVRHLRNSVAHFRFEALSNSSNEIDSIQFKDGNSNRVNFETTISVPNLLKFAIKLADYVLFEMQKNKNQANA